MKLSLGLIGTMLAFLLVSALPNQAVHAESTSAAGSCRFVLGFQTIHDLIAEIVGDCLVNEHYNPENGDALQETANGLLVWRKSDNFTALTDGANTWVNGPYGLQERLNTDRFSWETDAPRSATPTPRATTVPIPVPSPSTSACCKVCTIGKACGNSCINVNYTCHQPPGCACNAY